MAVIPMGLQDDLDLKELGITSHAMEDYLVKLLLLDRSLTSNVQRFRELLAGVTNTIKGYQ